MLVEPQGEEQRTFNASWTTKRIHERTNCEMCASNRAGIRTVRFQSRNKFRIEAIRAMRHQQGQHSERECEMNVGDRSQHDAL